jgi:hypothetical protein
MPATRRYSVIATHQSIIPPGCIAVHIFSVAERNFRGIRRSLETIVAAVSIAHHFNAGVAVDGVGGRRSSHERVIATVRVPGHLSPGVAEELI